MSQNETTTLTEKTLQNEAEFSTRVENVPTVSAQATSSTRSAPQSAAALTSSVAALPSVEELKREEQVAAIAMKARLDLRKGNRETAKTEIARALALNPNDLVALELMGDVFLEEGEQTKAILVFEKGRALYPTHVAFVEKIRLAQHDLDEMAVDQLTQKFQPPAHLLHDDIDVKPMRAAMLSLLIPGGGQFFLEQTERGALYLGLAIVALCGWALPLRNAMNHAGAAVKETGSIGAGWSNAIASMSGATQVLFWTMSTLFSALYLVSAWDAYSTVARRQGERRETTGLKEQAFKDAVLKKEMVKDEKLKLGI